MAGHLRVHRGALPDFLIIGAQKAGTTSLHAYLQSHPDVLPCATKEVSYFDDNYWRGEKWYRRHFLDRSRLQLDPKYSDRRLINGEATPDYLFYPEVAQRLSKTVPNAKLIVVLRDPVRRAYSQYQHYIRRRYERLSFNEAIETDHRVTIAALKRFDENPDYAIGFNAFGYLARGCYADQLDRYFKFFRTEQIMVIRSEDLFRSPSFVFAQVTKFLGIQSTPLEDDGARNVGTYKNKSVPCEEDLRKFFEPHNQRLYNLIRRDMGW